MNDAEQKEHEFEAGRIFGPNGELLSVVKGKTLYREVKEPAPELPTGRYV